MVTSIYRAPFSKCIIVFMTHLSDSGIATKEESAIPTSRFSLIMLLSTLTIGVFYCSDNPTIFSVQLQKELELSSTEYNLIFSVHSLPNIILPLVFGYFVDRMGGKVILMVSQVLILFGQLIFAYGTKEGSFTTLLFGRFVFGIGCDGLSVATSAIQTIWFRGKELAFAMSIDVSASNIMAFIIYAVEPAIYTSTGSLSITYFVGALLCLVPLGFSFIVYTIEQKREKMAQPRSDSTSTAATETNSENTGFKLSELSKLPKEFWLLCIVITMGSIPATMFTNVAAEFYQQRYSFTTQTAATLMGTQSLVLALCIPLIGYAVDKYGHHLLITSVGNIVYTGFFAYLYYVGSSLTEALMVVVVFGICDGVYLAGVWPALSYAIYKLSNRMVVPDYMLGSAHGIIGAISNVLSVIGPVFTGLIIDTNKDSDTGNKLHGYKMLGLFYIGLYIISSIPCIMLIGIQLKLPAQGNSASAPKKVENMEMKDPELNMQLLNY